ncbi:MAG: DUF983 domain-containing protein [Hyphomicrobiales bacterium]|nr:DUF983 domain-containing protein [Hyphomicrobiales bacterium]MCP5001800.1 DUF983 domain-containing protein [Hyphomicrobiales bacterium]
MSEDDNALYPPVDPIRSGLAGRCPRCGEGKLFEGYLAPEKSCTHCGLDYGFADAGDGPAVFVILLVGFLVVGFALWLEVNYGPPLWLHLLLWIPLSVGICMWLLRALKGVLINLQFKNNAHEGQLDND